MPKKRRTVLSKSASYVNEKFINESEQKNVFKNEIIEMLPLVSLIHGCEC